MRRAAAALLALAALPAVARAAQSPYSLAGGCYDLSGALTASSVRMQASGLGRYLLYLPDGRFLTPAGRMAQPVEWRYDDAVRFTPASGCATFPEAELNATGTPSRGASPQAEVRGFADGHTHWMTYSYFGGDFHCGRPWHPYGIPYALPDCADDEGPQGLLAPAQNFFNSGLPVAPHDTKGWPSLAAWAHDNVTYEAMYHRWVQRAWMGGLRLMVVPFNETRFLCELVVKRHHPCDEMTTVRRQIPDIFALRDYIDAQAGGPGKGFMRIVTDPFQARRAINAGKLAVILEVEISELFGCRSFDQPRCTRAQIDEGLDWLHARGVRSLFLVNKLDNAFGGVRMNEGPTGVVVNVGNRVSDGSFWQVRTCTGARSDNEVLTGNAATDVLLRAGLNTLVPPGALPAYPRPPHCNARGLSALGAYLENRLIDKRMIVNLDHLSSAGVDAGLKIAEARGYSGVVSPHGWMDPRDWTRVWALGGWVAPQAGDAASFAATWQRYRPARTPFAFGWGWGADVGGLAVQGAPRGGPNPVTYPFKSFDGRVTLDRQRTGTRVFDVNRDGVAHYGMYPDWVEDLRHVAGQRIVDDLAGAAEAYLQMWERAVGVPRERCQSRRSRAVRRGMTAEAVLRAAGQPRRRSGRRFVYRRCGGGRFVVTFTTAGRVTRR
ncbi:MAG TPA: Coagulation factor 5/8 type domain-containing protein [Solirubrobacteraceae bacterium]